MPRNSSGGRENRSDCAQPSTAHRNGAATTCRWMQWAPRTCPGRSCSHCDDGRDPARYAFIAAPPVQRPAAGGGGNDTAHEERGVCGIVGFSWNGTSRRRRRHRPPARWRTGLAHRGPDDAGVWLDPGAGAALAHRRLAVVDRSPAGHQPMRSASGQRVIVFNGEIYNHQDLRRRLDADRQGISWRGHSDTETLLAAIECWGLEEALRASTGMFALALWDREDRGPLAGPRPDRRKAALLRLAERRVPVRLRAEGARGASRVRGRHRQRRARPALAPWSCFVPRVHIRRHSQAAAGHMRQDGRRRCQAGRWAICRSRGRTDRCGTR